MRTLRAAIVGMMLGCLLLATRAHAQAVPAPHLMPGDTWTYQSTVENKSGWHQTRDEATVVRASASEIVLSTKPAGSTGAPVERLLASDWSRFRSVNGHETVVNRPLSFPLNPGKSWTLDYTEEHPNAAHARETVHSVYTVTGWEDVTVPAGTLHAIKVEAEGQWTATLAPALASASGARVDAQGTTSVVQTHRTTATTASGRIYKAFWYVPAAKRWAKSVEEYYDANGVRSERFTNELAAFTVAN